MDGTKKRLILTALLAAALPVLVATSGEAQTVAHTFDELRILVASGDTVYITEQNERERPARVLEVSGSSLAVLMDGTRRDLEQGAVMRIRKRVGDPLWNGAVIGAATGVGAAIAIGASLDAFEDCGAACVALNGGIYGGIGALVGVGIDALIKSRRTIYAATDRERRARVVLRPDVAGATKALNVSVTF
jgi:hypothetical protein